MNHSVVGDSRRQLFKPRIDINLSNNVRFQAFKNPENYKISKPLLPRKYNLLDKERMNDFKERSNIRDCNNEYNEIKIIKNMTSNIENLLIKLSGKDEFKIRKFSKRHSIVNRHTSLLEKNFNFHNFLFDNSIVGEGSAKFERNIKRRRTFKDDYISLPRIITGIKSDIKPIWENDGEFIKTEGNHLSDIQLEKIETTMINQERSSKQSNINFQNYHSYKYMKKKNQNSQNIKDYFSSY